MYWTKTVRACLEPNVSKMTRELVAVTDAWGADVAVWDMAIWKNIAGNPYLWTRVPDSVTIAGEAADNGPDIDIDSLGNTAAAAEDEEKARMENCGQVGHWVEVWLAAPAARWVGESS